MFSLITYVVEKYLYVFILLFSFSVSVYFLLISIDSRSLPDHDEAISFQSATCNQIAFRENQLQGKWISVKEWQQLWTFQDKGCYEEIDQGLTKYDIHPPLYFWSLHTWFCISKPNIRNGLYLNILFFAFTFFLIYFTARNLQISQTFSALICSGWSFSGVTLMTALTMRQYLLFSMLVVLSFLTLLLTVKKPNFKNKLLLLLTITAGILTHYNFVIYLAVFQLVMGIYILKKGRFKLLLALMLLTLFALSLAFIFHDGYMTVFEKAETIASLPYDAFSFQDRLDNLRHAFSRIFITKGIEAKLADHFMVETIFGILLLVLVYISTFIHKKRIRHLLKPNIVIPFTIAALLTGLISFQYLSGIIFFHAMGFRYIAPLSIILIISVSQLLYSLLQTINPPKLFIILFSIALLYCQYRFAEFRTRSIYVYMMDDHRTAELLKHDNVSILVNTTRRGYIPGILWELPGSAQVYIDEPSEIVQNLEEIVKDKDDVYFVSLHNDPASLKAIKSLENYSLTKDGKHTNTGALYHLQKIEP